MSAWTQHFEHPHFIFGEVSSLFATMGIPSALQITLTKPRHGDGRQTAQFHHLTFGVADGLQKRIAIGLKIKSQIDEYIGRMNSPFNPAFSGVAISLCRPNLRP